MLRGMHISDTSLELQQLQADRIVCCPDRKWQTSAERRRADGPDFLKSTLKWLLTLPCPEWQHPIWCPPLRCPHAPLTWTVKGANFLLFLRCTRYCVVPSLAKSTFSSSLLM